MLWQRYLNPLSCPPLSSMTISMPCPSTHLNLWAWWWRGPGYRRLGDWYSCDRRAWLVFWLGLLANLTVMGSAAPDGFCPFRPLMASSASILLSKRMKPTPREPPAGPADHKQTQAPFTLQGFNRTDTIHTFVICRHIYILIYRNWRWLCKKFDKIIAGYNYTSLIN